MHVRVPESGRFDMSDMSVLIVDDDESLVRELAAKLRGEGYEVLVGMDGLQALMQAQRKGPDLILLDMRMPAGDGFFVLDKLDDSIKTMRIPVIAMIAPEDAESVEKARAYGADEIIMKPFDADRLLELVSRRLAPPEVPQ